MADEATTPAEENSAPIVINNLEVAQDDDGNRILSLDGENGEKFKITGLNIIPVNEGETPPPEEGESNNPEEKEDGDASKEGEEEETPPPATGEAQ